MWKLNLGAIALLSLSTVPMAGQTASRNAAIPRLTDGHPNLNGIWQAMNTANIDLLDHSSKQSPVMEMGALGAEPGGPGVVEGGTIPYKPDALAKKKDNQAKRMALDPEVRCYLPGVPRATYMPYPFQIFHSTKALAIAYQYDGAFR